MTVGGVSYTITKYVEFDETTDDVETLVFNTIRDYFSGTVVTNTFAHLTIKMTDETELQWNDIIDLRYDLDNLLMKVVDWLESILPNVCYTLGKTDWRPPWMFRQLA